MALIDSLLLDEHFDDWTYDQNTVVIPSAEYEALTTLESHVRRVAAKRSPVDRRTLSALLERVRSSRRSCL